MARLVQLGALLLTVIVCSAKPADDRRDVDLRMPHVHPQVVDSYLCYPMKMPEDPTYITGFVPHSNMATAHHMLLFGCEEPGDTGKTWTCGEMQSDAYPDQKPVCNSIPKILYAWAMDAPELKLPKGVGFKVGGDTDVKWLVLQVHYKNVTKFLPPLHGTDNSGVTMHTTSVPQPKRAGVYLLSTDGRIPPHSTTYMESACSIDEPVDIHPFAYRVHAHAHGEVVSGYRVRDGKWTEIGRMSPKKPQMFYNVTHPGMTIEEGDIVAARCTMVNNENRTVKVGQTQQDEMCNFYMMYWVPGEHLLDDNYCTTAGPPNWYWNKIASIHVENIPDSASIIPGTDKLLKSTEQIANKMTNLIEEAHNEINEDLLELLGEMAEPEANLEVDDDINELKEEQPYEYQNEMGGYDPEDFRRVMFGGYQPGAEPWYGADREEDDYPRYREHRRRPFYPQY